MVVMTIRLPDATHERLRDLARSRVVSMNKVMEDLATRASVGYTADLSVDGQLAQLLRLRVARVKACSYCLILHTQAAHDQGIAHTKVAHLPAWRESAVFDEKERAALTYCEGLTAYGHENFAPLHDALVKHFDEHGVAEIAAGTGLTVRDKLFLGWFGPRGIASILFTLIVIDEYDLRAEEELLACVSMTVALSILLHGLSAYPLARHIGRGV